MSQFLSKCRKCNYSMNTITELNSNQFILCNNCKNSSKLYSKTFCLDQLLLSNDNLSNLKYLYIPNNKAKYYLDDDIEKIIKLQFDEINKRKIKKQIRKENIKKQQELRKQQLIVALAEYKLELKTFGDCTTFIKYGYPDLSIVVKNELEKSIELSRRKKKIYKKLKKMGLPYIERKNSICYNYTNTDSNYTMNDVIDDAKLDDFFIKYTDYQNLRKIYPDDDVAREKALIDYLHKTDKSKTHKIVNNLIEKTFTLNID